MLSAVAVTPKLMT